MDGRRHEGRERTAEEIGQLLSTSRAHARRRHPPDDVYGISSRARACRRPLVPGPSHPRATTMLRIAVPNRAPCPSRGRHAPLGGLPHRCDPRSSSSPTSTTPWSVYLRPVTSPSTSAPAPSTRRDRPRPAPRLRFRGRRGLGLGRLLDLPVRRPTGHASPSPTSAVTAWPRATGPRRRPRRPRCVGPGRAARRAVETTITLGRRCHRRRRRDRRRHCARRASRSSASRSWRRGHAGPARGQRRRPRPSRCSAGGCSASSPRATTSCSTPTCRVPRRRRPARSRQAWRPHRLLAAEPDWCAVPAMVPRQHEHRHGQLLNLGARAILVTTSPPAGCERPAVARGRRTLLRRRRGGRCRCVWAVVTIALSSGVALGMGARGVRNQRPARPRRPGRGIAGFLWRYVGIRAVPDAEGLTCATSIVTRRVTSDKVVEVRFPEGAPWVTLELDDGDDLAVMAVQPPTRPRPRGGPPPREARGAAPGGRSLSRTGPSTLTASISRCYHKS